MVCFLQRGLRVGWFGCSLNEQQCQQFGAGAKQTVIYKLELAASILALDFWAEKMRRMVCRFALATMIVLGTP